MAATRVFLVIPSLAPGGSERVLVRLAAGLDPERFEPEVVTLAAAGPLDQEIPERITRHNLDAGRVLAALPRFVRLARKRRPAAIISFQMHVNLALLLLRPFLPRGVRIVAREESMPSRTCADSPLPRVFGAMIRRLYPKAHAVLALCDAAAAELTGQFGVPQDKVAVVPNPVDIDAVRARALNDALDKDALPPLPRLVFAGRLAPVKRVDVVLEALARMQRRASLMIVGGGDENAMQSLRERAKALGVAERVLFTGHQSNPYPYIQSADLLVLASLREGQPLVAQEALALGTPVVSAAMPGCIPDMIRHGVNGFLAPFHTDSEQQAKALAATLDNALDALDCRPGRMDTAKGIEAWAQDAVCRAHEKLIE
ncbi:glycosyltransferase [Oceanidesulfovibrio marinus]|uniref:Glycosyltransferase n=1 Tax=Oceanidesulfovibrio marinus TaxID=370038 RepID=A0ABX6NET0_9BACT|nr:glycosyltransferase [Oceanidesulfovibrio marinus]QJT09121.1 glycosyltransferase [Oceanidesulfovibrio marinus]